MLLGYNRPSDITWTIGGTGASIDTDDSSLTNGRPGDVTRFTWLNGSQTTSSVVTLDASWPSAQATKPRVFAILGITLPAGTLVKVQFPDSSTWEDPTGGNFSQRVQELPDGSRAVWMVVDAPDSDIETFRLEFYNDVNGSADIAADSEFDIGEIFFAPIVTLPLRPGWNVAQDDSSRVNESLSHQVWSVERQTRRILIGELAGIEKAKVAESGLDNGEDLQTIIQAVSAAKPCAAIMRWTKDNSSDLDPPILHRFAQFGYVPPNTNLVDHVVREHFTGPWEHREIPAKPVS